MKPTFTSNRRLRLSRPLLHTTPILGVLALLCGFGLLASAPAFAAKEYVPGISIGAGDFAEPAGVAVNDSTELGEPAAGDVYVVDEANDRVDRFGSSGAYLGDFDGSGTFEVEGKVEKGVAAPTGTLSSPEQIAIDDSGKSVLADPSVGDVYVEDTGNDVIDKFSSTGAYLGQLTETTGGSLFSGLRGVAVDPAGDLWVYEADRNVDEFSDTGSFMEQFNTGIGISPGLAVDSGENVYVISGGETVVKFDSTTGAETAWFGGSAKALAIDPSTNDPFVDYGSGVAVYGPEPESAATQLETFPSEGLSGSRGIAVDSAGTVYVSQAGADDVQVFEDLIFPTVTTGSATGVSETAATLNGTVNPAGEAITECRFEYGTETSYGQSVACKQTPAEINALSKGGAESVAVSAELPGLQPRTSYHFRLQAANANRSKNGSDETLYTFGHPVIESESFSDVGSVFAQVSAQIDAGGLPTTYHVEYGPSSAYGSSTPDTALGSSKSNAGAIVQLSALQAGTEYHFRFVATNTHGAIPGNDDTFTTSPAGIGGLPDGRVLERVSVTPYGQDSNAYIPGSDSQLSTFGEHGLTTSTSFQIANNGEAVIYPGESPAIGGNAKTATGNGNTFLAKRSTAGGWTNEDIIPSGKEDLNYLGFSEDLSVGVLNDEAPGGEGIASDAPQSNALYWHSTKDGPGGEYHPLFTVTPANKPSPLYAGANTGTSTVPASSHLLFEADAGLLEGEGKIERELAQDVDKEIKEGTIEQRYVGYLYDSVDGRPYLVDVLPDGEVAPDASFGSVQNTDEDEPGLSHVISADGSRIFWTWAPEETLSASKALYVRENDTEPQSPIGPKGECTVPADACTVQVDEAVGGEGIFQTATPDGSKVLFTKRSTGELYEYDVDTRQTTAIAPGVAAKGVVGTSEDGEYVYYAVASNGDIDLWHAGRTTLVAAGGANMEEQPFGEGGGNGLSYDWEPSIESHTAEVTPNGESLVFMSNENLTGYDSEGLNEVFLYAAGSGALRCVSCSPSGEAPSTATQLRVDEDKNYGYVRMGAFIPSHIDATYRPRVISEDGSRVFFQADQPLVPQDTAGYLNVFEWERDGTGSCDNQQGCVYMLTNGANPEDSYLIGASASGDDVFFISAEADNGGSDQVYDARVGGVLPIAPPSCSGTGCQGVPAAPPIFATPSSVTFNGVGNFAPQAPPTKVTTKKTAKCRTGFTKAHGKCVKAKRKHKKKQDKKKQAKKASDNRRAQS